MIIGAYADSIASNSFLLRNSWTTFCISTEQEFLGRFNDGIKPFGEHLQPED